MPEEITKANSYLRSHYGSSLFIRLVWFPSKTPTEYNAQH